VLGIICSAHHRYHCQQLSDLQAHIHFTALQNSRARDRDTAVTTRHPDCATSIALAMVDKDFFLQFSNYLCPRFRLFTRNITCRNHRTEVAHCRARRERCENQGKGSSLSRLLHHSQQPPALSMKQAYNKVVSIRLDSLSPGSNVHFLMDLSYEPELKFRSGARTSNGARSPVIEHQTDECFLDHRISMRLVVSCAP